MPSKTSPGTSIPVCQTPSTDVGIFDQLRVMVAEQGSEMQRVDENVDDALSNVEQGHQQLLRYWRRVSSNQGLMIRVFAVLMFFVVLFGTVM